MQPCPKTPETIMPPAQGEPLRAPREKFSSSPPSSCPGGGKAPDDAPLLEARGLGVRVRASGETLVSDVSLTLRRGRCLGVVGESGSGKTLICRALLGLLPPSLAAGGEALFQGYDMLTASPEEARRRRGVGLGLLLQHPMTAFDPLRTIEAHFLESLRARRGLAPEEARARIMAGLADMGLDDRALRAYPHQLSGGMLQRCMIALTLSLEPAVVVADEPTTALDARHQFALVRRLARLRRERALLVVSHDLAVMQALADDVLVLHKGRPVESGPAAEVLSTPRHAVARRLLESRRALSREFLRLRETQS